MRRIVGLVLAAGLCFPAFSQDNTAVKYSEFINAESAKTHLSVLASDDFEGRETGTAGADKAADYLAEHLKQFGISGPVNGSYFQKVELEKKQIEVETFKVNGSSFTHLTDFYVYGSPVSTILKSEKVFFAGYGISDEKYDDLKDYDLRGRIVLIYNSGEPTKNGISYLTGSRSASSWSTSAKKRMDVLESKNPALILAVNPFLSASLEANRAHYQEPNVELKTSTADAGRKPIVISITPEMANAFLKSSGKTIEDLKRGIDESGRPASQVIKGDFEIKLGTKITSIKAQNVLGYLEGTDLKEELVVISAHYDHIGLNPAGTDKVYNGADDDGSGTTGVLALAEAFSLAKKQGHGPRRSVLFLFNTGEEKGLLGSEWYSDHPVFPLANTITNLNIDMIGRIDPSHKSQPDYCYLIGSDKLSSELHKISEAANGTYTKLQLDYKYNDPGDPEKIYYRSDHYNFARKGIPIIFYFNGVHEDYHQPGDEVSKIDFPLLTKRARLVFFTAWELLNREKRPAVDSNKK